MVVFWDSGEVVALEEAIERERESLEGSDGFWISKMVLLGGGWMMLKVGRGGA